MRSATGRPDPAPLRQDHGLRRPAGDGADGAGQLPALPQRGHAGAAQPQVGQELQGPPHPHPADRPHPQLLWRERRLLLPLRAGAEQGHGAAGPLCRLGRVWSEPPPRRLGLERRRGKCLLLAPGGLVHQLQQALEAHRGGVRKPLGHGPAAVQRGDTRAREPTVQRRAEALAHRRERDGGGANQVEAPARLGDIRSWTVLLHRPDRPVRVRDPVQGQQRGCPGSLLGAQHGGARRLGADPGLRFRLGIRSGLAHGQGAAPHHERLARVEGPQEVCGRLHQHLLLLLLRRLLPGARRPEGAQQPAPAHEHGDRLRVLHRLRPAGHRDALARVLPQDLLRGPRAEAEGRRLPAGRGQLPGDAGEAPQVLRREPGG
mmetsp:Transcript_106665/g.318861  ORF Transcript_106665/g.318861 Transcript_106665/m.318861 type:complete len:374 (-) Transcript_106665:616-1737(-)